MVTTRHRLNRAVPRSIRVALAMLLVLIACGKDGDHYAPLPDNPNPQAQTTVVAGAVRNPGKHAVADALVIIEPAQNGVAAAAAFMKANPGLPSESTPGRRVTVTNSAGRFAFPDVSTGEYFLQVIADDHLGAMQSVKVPDPIAIIDTIIVDVNLTPTGTFSGLATLENAVAHQGTVVYVQGTSYVAVTNPTGAYAITDVPVGSYTVRAEHAHYLEDTENGTITTAGENVVLPNMLLRIDSNIPPVATIASATPQIENVPVQFVASGSDADGTVVLYEWDWENDGIFDYSNASSGNTSHTYGSGPHTAKLRVTDNDGAIGLAAVLLTIDANAAPTATIVSASPQTDGVPVNFVANGSDPDGTIVLYQWDWENDGTFDYSSAVNGNASRLYAAGSYVARFRVTDDDGAIDDDTVPISIVAGYVYVSSVHGNDFNPGTSTSPVLTLPVGYSIAQANGITKIKVEEGTYANQAPVFQGGIDVLGGRTWPSWNEGPGHSLFTFTGTRATASNITTSTLIRRVAVQLLLPSGGQNSIALYSLNSSSNLRFEECRFIAANGLGGASGGSGSAGAIGGNGLGGGNGSCDGAPGGAGGAGGSSSGGCAGGSGGVGGFEGANSGQPGAQGVCGGGTGGTPGGGGDPGGTGGNGVAGPNGSTGASGSAGSGSGSVAGNEWVPSNSTAGGTGGSGHGGGGGGGGGGQGCTFCDDGSGNGGGGGGGGGAGGTGGQGGGGGRASFAVMLVNSSPQFDLCYFQRGNGGLGGNGGSGGNGGTGGSGGAGGAACTGEVGRGGNGALGGTGGTGGGGAGGPGGPSYGVYKANGSAPTITNATFVAGSGGTGGTGGSPNGPTGGTGLSGNTN